MKTSKMLDGYPQRSCAALLPPSAAFPPIPRPSFAPLCRDLLKPPSAAAF